MNIIEVIEKKRDGKKLTSQEIEFFVAGCVNGKIADYQASALLMAMFINGLDNKELTALAGAMANSGERFNFNSTNAPIVDKHSTGGVGDGTSLVLAPLLASCGVAVPMISGRGLGHTGGTLDKLQGIPGIKLDLKKETAEKQLSKLGLFMVGQTAQYAPADKYLYALRDATATVPSIGLISASIMSKKLIENLSVLVLDVKFGKGAFMQSVSQAKKLASVLIGIAKENSIKCGALITNMNNPLGRAVGNNLELIQSIEILKGSKEPNDFYNLVIELGKKALVLSKIVKTEVEAEVLLKRNLSNGKAFNIFCSMISAQGGNVEYIKNTDKLEKSKNQVVVRAGKSGFVGSIDAKQIGFASVLLGAGRIKKEDLIDQSAGIVLNKVVGEKVLVGDVLATLHTNNKSCATDVVKRVLNAYEISKALSKKNKIVECEI